MSLDLFNVGIMYHSEIRLKVKAGASQDKIDGWTDGENRVLKISVKQVPEQGKANKAIIKFLSKAWKIPQKRLEIISGHTSNYKTLVIRD